jgi:hypothetical protein
MPFGAITQPSTGGGGGGGPVEKSTDDLLWADLQAGSYSDGDLFKNTTSGAVYSAQATSESFGGVLIPAQWGQLTNIRLQTSTAPWPAAFGTDPRTNGDVGKGYFQLGDALTDLTGSSGRGFDLSLGGSGTVTKSAGGNLICNSVSSGSGHSGRMKFCSSDRESGWTTSPSYTGPSRQIMCIRSVSYGATSSNAEGPHVLCYGLQPNQEERRWYTYLSPALTGPWLSRWNSYGSDITSDGGYRGIATSGDHWIYILCDVVGPSSGSTEKNPTSSVFVGGQPLEYSWARDEMNQTYDSGAAGWAAYNLVGSYGLPSGSNSWEIREAYFLLTDV